MMTRKKISDFKSSELIYPEQSGFFIPQFRLLRKPKNTAIHFLLLYLPLCFLLLSSCVFSQKKIETGDIEFDFKKTASFDKSALLDILLLPKEKYFNRINLADDLQRLNKYYFDNGFFDALIDTSTSFDAEDEVVNVKFSIIENTRYTIREIVVDGIEKVTEPVKNEINRERIINPGEPYIRAKVTLERDRIYNVLQNNGYYFAQIDTGRSKADSSRLGIIIGKYSEKLQENPEFKDKVLVKFTFIGTEDIYRFGDTRINIIKNKYNLSKSVIERELKFKQGDIFNRSKMLESERNFTKLAIIQLGRVLVDTVKHSSKTVDINVDITLSNKYEIIPSISGVYQSNRFFGGVALEYKDKDFFGGGRVFSVKPEGLYNSKEINNATLTFSIFQPFLFRSNITATLSSTFGYYNFNEFIEYLYSQNLLRLSYYIADFTFYNNAYSDLTFDYIRERAKESYFDDTLFVPKNQKDYFVNSILGLTLLHNNTNSLSNPSSGFFHSITVESAGALARLLSIFNTSLKYSQYVKLYTPNSFYFDISGGYQNSIFATHFEVGDIIEYGSGENIEPVNEIYKFYSGGGNSLRGWGAQENGILNNTKLGGNFLVEGSFEWRRRPFPQRSFLYPLWGVLFLDWGNVWETDGKFRLDQIALAAGFGIRYDTFVGPVRIDVGFKLFDPSKGQGDRWLWDKPSEIFKSKYAIQFGLGNAF
jgi:outer membrane protein insertion porin family